MGILNLIWTQELRHTFKQIWNVILSGGFKAGIADSFIKSFCENYGLISPVKKTTRFKNPENSSSIDLILTNKPQSFIKTGIIEKSFSDFHKLVTTVMKMHFTKSKASIITYRSYKKFKNKKLKAEIVNQTNYLEKDDKDAFSSIWCKVLNKLAPQK